MSTAARRAIYGKLAGDTTLAGMLAAPPAGFSKSIFYQQAPDYAAFPYVMFSKQSAVPTQAFHKPSAFENYVWLIKAVDRSDSVDVAEAISERIATLLNDASLSISGATLCMLRRQSDVDYPEVTDGAVYRHCGSLYRLVTTS